MSVAYLRVTRQRLRRLWEEFALALVITRREVRDTVRDWRLVMPIVVLVTVFPFLANFAAVRGLAFVNRYGANLIAERLFPFLMLVVGFFPSSFSLVIALETFVGEKERRSLEPLLATPLTDLQLYVGKLLAATIPPVVGSYLGMAVYVVMLGFSSGWWPSFHLLLVSVVLATAEALVMVTAAVIVSSQSTSVRAANLLASFIIIPMAFLLQGEAGLLLFANYTALWWIALSLGIVNVMLVRLGVRLFNREHLLGRDIDTLDVKGMWKTFWRAAWPRAGLVTLYRHELPQLLRAIRAELIVTLLVVFVGAPIIGIWGAQRFVIPKTLLAFSGRLDVETIERAVARAGLVPALATWPILLHNVRSLLGAALMGLFSMGVLALLLLMAPIALLVYLALQVARVGVDPWLFFGVFVLPHGMMELPAAILATAQALRMGDVILQPPEEGGGVMGIVREIGHFFKLLVFLLIPMLGVAAWVEAEITPYVVAHVFGG